MLKNKNIFLDFMLAGVLFLLVLFMLMLTSCKHEPEVLPIEPLTGNNGNGNNGGNGSGNGNGNVSTCDPDSVYFETQILPLLVSNCAKPGCHTPQDHQDGVVLNSYLNIMATGDVRPGNPGNSDLYEVLVETDPDDKMPPEPATPLTSSQINLIYRWIAQGAKDNSCSNTCDTTNVTFSATVFPLLQANCVGCHSGSAPGGNIRLENYANVLAVAQNGKLLGSVNHSAGYKAMPFGGNKLPACNIDQIRIWVDGGAQNN